MESEIGGPGYGALLTEIKAAVGAARLRAARVVNHAVVDLYWQVGHLILLRQDEEGWGTRVIDRLSVDLRTEFPGMRGFSARSLVYMRTLAKAYPGGIAQEPLAQLPWSHITVLLDKVPNPEVRAWYAAKWLAVTHSQQWRNGRTHIHTPSSRGRNIRWRQRK